MMEAGKHTNLSQDVPPLFAFLTHKSIDSECKINDRTRNWIYTYLVHMKKVILDAPMQEWFNYWIERIRGI